MTRKLISPKRIIVAENLTHGRYRVSVKERARVHDDCPFEVIEAKIAENDHLFKVVYQEMYNRFVEVKR